MRRIVHGAQARKPSLERGEEDLTSQDSGRASAVIDVVAWGVAILFGGLVFLSIGGVRISHCRELCLRSIIAAPQAAAGLLLGVYRFGGRKPLSRLDLTLITLVP